MSQLPMSYSYNSPVEQRNSIHVLTGGKLPGQSKVTQLPASFEANVLRSSCSKLTCHGPSILMLNKGHPHCYKNLWGRFTCSWSLVFPFLILVMLGGRKRFSLLSTLPLLQLVPGEKNYYNFSTYSYVGKKLITLVHTHCGMFF